MFRGPVRGGPAARGLRGLRASSARLAASLANTAWPASRRRRQGLGPGRSPSTGPGRTRGAPAGRPGARRRPPRLNVVPRRPLLGDQRGQGVHVAGHELPFAPLGHHGRRRSGGPPVRRSPRPPRVAKRPAVQHMRPGEGVAVVQVRWVEPPRMDRWGTDGGLVCPCVGGHPALPSGNSDRSGAALSPSAKLLVSWYLHRCAEPGRCLLLARRPFQSRRDCRANALVIATLPIVVPGGTGNARANPQAAKMDRRLILEGGFVVDDGRNRLLKDRARVLGFEDLGAYLQARCDAGASIPRIATEL